MLFYICYTHTVDIQVFTAMSVTDSRCWLVKINDLKNGITASDFNPALEQSHQGQKEKLSKVTLTALFSPLSVQQQEQTHFLIFHNAASVIGKCNWNKKHLIKSEQLSQA